MNIHGKKLETCCLRFTKVAAIAVIGLAVCPVPNGVVNAPVTQAIAEEGEDGFVGPMPFTGPMPAQGKTGATKDAKAKSSAKDRQASSGDKSKDAGGKAAGSSGSMAEDEDSKATVSDADFDVDEQDGDVEAAEEIAADDADPSDYADYGDEEYYDEGYYEEEYYDEPSDSDGSSDDGTQVTASGAQEFWFQTEAWGTSQSLVDAGYFVEFLNHWWASHWYNERGQQIQSMQPGDIVHIDGETVRIAGAFNIPYDGMSAEEVRAEWPTEYLFQTCYGSNYPYMLIQYGYPV